MRRYIVIHHWSGQQTEYCVLANEAPEEEELVKALDLDFEPDKGDTIELFLAPEVDATIYN